MTASFHLFSFLCCGEAVAEIQDLILYRISPVCPPMHSRTYIEIMRNTFLHELVVKIAVHLIEEVFCTAVYDNVE